jgi:hypothetical protein
MIHTKARLAVLRSDIMHQRRLLAEIADLPGYENDRTLLFRELVRCMTIYKVLLRNRRQQRPIALRQRPTGRSDRLMHLA